MRVLVLNAGSSSLKASVLDSDRVLAREALDWGADATRAPDRQAAIQGVLEHLAVAGVPVGSIDAVGHRVVHGGPQFTGPVVVDDAVLGELEAVSELAPLHNPVGLETIRGARAALPQVPNVAAFDTAFHATLPDAARLYPVPERWTVEWGTRRYGFHGLSVAWAVPRAAQLLGRPAQNLGLVVAHLGSGCSVTAVDGGRSVDTSMGMTPLEGLMMGTRAGSIDPGILLMLLREERLALDELAEDLDHRSGLFGVSGSTSDMRRLVEAVDARDPKATLAIEMFVRRAAAGIAAAATALGQLDGIVFTAGIGEHAATVRAAIVDRLTVLGVEPIPALEVTEDALLSRLGASVAVLRIEAREDVVIAREVERLVG
jgi:acetate kinase